MSECKGDGECLKQKGNSYLPSNCCHPIECRNYKYCNNKLPKLVLDANNGMCINCAVQMGNHITTDDIRICHICSENKKMIKLNCGHRICNDCWFKHSSPIKKNFNWQCPFCKENNGW